MALTRAKDSLYVTFPLRYFHAYRDSRTDRHGSAQLTRFVTKSVKQRLTRVLAGLQSQKEWEDDAPNAGKKVRGWVRAMWE